MNAWDNSLCPKDNITKFTMNNIEIESLDKGTVVVGDLELVGWVLLKYGKSIPSRSQADFLKYNSNILRTSTSFLNYLSNIA